MTSTADPSARPSGVFLREFLRHPLLTASLVPSSRAVAEAMCAPIPRTGDPVVVELGAGTGSLTGVVAERLGGRGHHLAVELNPRLAEVLASRFPGLDVAVAPAAEVPALLAERGLDACDVVLSGLPWAAWPDTPPRLTDVLAGAMRPDGALTQFGYAWTRWAPPAHRLRQRLTEAFEDVVTGPVIVRNVPPAFVHTARRPRRPAG